MRNAGMLAFFLILVATPGRAQSISGTVYDQDGGVVVGARVLLMQDYVKRQETKTDENGNFVFDALSAGTYEVQVKRPGFSLFQQTLFLKASQPERVFAVLPLARAVDKMTITGDVPPAARNPQRPAGQMKRVGGRFEGAKLIEAPGPRYPDSAQERGVQGYVVLFAAIKTNGSLGEPRVLQSPDPELEYLAVETVKKWRYQPTRLNGQPVETYTTIVLKFQLAQ